MPTLYTIGHSNHALDEFLEIICAHAITQIIDIRAIPKSSLFPWFNKEELAKTLTQSKIKYQHLPQLGGRRKTTKASRNTGWTNDSFRGFADYMQTKEFFLGLKTLNEFLKNKDRTAMMCAEALPWRCHRSLIADAEIARGINVLDILSKTNLEKHELTSFAVIDKSVKPIQVYYPNPNISLKNQDEK